jgi:hypothetical protein
VVCSTVVTEWFAASRQELTCTKGGVPSVYVIDLAYVIWLLVYSQSSPNAVVICYGNGDGTFSAGATVNPITGSGGSSLAPLDFNHDGIM